MKIALLLSPLFKGRNENNCSPILLKAKGKMKVFRPAIFLGTRYICGSSFCQPMGTHGFRTQGVPQIKQTVDFLNATAAIPAAIISNGRTRGALNILIKAKLLEPLLATFVEAGFDVVNIVMFAGGIVVQGRARVYKRYNGNGYDINPLGELKKYLRSLYLQNRGDTPKWGKRPLPVVILAVTPVAKGVEIKSASEAGGA